MTRNLKFLLVLIAGVVIFSSCKEDEHGDWKTLNNQWLDQLYEQHKDEEDFFRTESGLCYKVIHDGFLRYPNENSLVRVQYKGQLIDGEVFDEGIFYRYLTEAIPGWQEGLRRMRGGSRYLFYIPAEMAYGEEGQGSIPPHSVLIFDVTLLESYN
jgi:FKBP-type peptidyl-prolyl cis-trans isomerase